MSRSSKFLSHVALTRLEASRVARYDKATIEADGGGSESRCESVEVGDFVHDGWDVPVEYGLHTVGVRCFGVNNPEPIRWRYQWLKPAPVCEHCTA